MILCGIRENPWCPLVSSCENQGIWWQNQRNVVFVLSVVFVVFVLFVLSVVSVLFVLSAAPSLRWFCSGQRPQKKSLFDTLVGT